MKTTNFLLTILLILLVSGLFGQENASKTPEISEGVNSTAMNWRPFTIEVNSSNLGHGLAFEKELIRKLSLRASVSSDFENNNYYDNSMSYKIGFGALYNLLDYQRIAVRTGINIGVRNIQQDYFAHEGIIGCFMGPIDPIKAAYAEIPILLQFRIFNNFSLDLGVSSLFQREVYFEDVVSSLDFGGYEYSPIEDRELSYHVGLRYRFSD